MNPHDDDGSWHLDKKVPLALIFAILVQTAMGFWWASNQDTRLVAVERQVQAAAPQGDRLTRVEVKIENIQAGVDEIKALIRQHPDAPALRPRGGDRP